MTPSNQRNEFPLFSSTPYSLGFDLVSVSLIHKALETLGVRLRLESKQCVVRADFFSLPFPAVLLAYSLI